MLAILFPLLGGIGLFLVGMMLLSGGLVAFAGPALQQALAHFTGTPRRAFASGALITALAQSSTATTVTLIGFVSAGLITFAQAIGVVIGASLGNTATGWIVAGLGLKISLGFYTLPLIGIGALLRLLARERWANLGMALAGFGVLFVGLDTLQQGMRGLSDVFSLADLPAGGIGARFFIMLIGIALTAVLQSSTAAIAMTLTAVHTEAINFDQATAMVIGASIGTTLTSLLVSIGATVHAKRTAMAHILFNLIAGLIAIALLPLYSLVINLFATHAGLAPGALVLAAFHTLFIAVGVVLVLPFSERFARLVERLLPERGDVATQHLDSSLLAIPAVALDASQRALDQIAQRLFDIYGRILAGEHPENLQQTLRQTHEALDRCFDFVSRIPLPGNDDFASRRIAQLHAIDHLIRFRERLIELDQVRSELGNPVYGEALAQNRHILALAIEGFAQPDHAWLERMAADAAALTTLARRIRHGVLHDTGPDSAARALRVTDTFRRLERSGHHVWRICHYLRTVKAAVPKVDTAAQPEPEEGMAAPEAVPEQAPAPLGQLAGETGTPPEAKAQA
ncbi:MAG: Na/Pi symporter [Gammaproteobacteria bacterium]|jgi:phosphate:Na+ symporter|nr:Na/Pi symporter [Gammaproteobacteria bacterium]